MIDIDEIMMLLDWNRSHAEQAKGIHMAQNVKCLKAFFQPIGANYGKNVWENCAVIISERSDEELKMHLVELLEWLQDMNWPGAFRILDRLQKYSDDKSIHIAINVCIEKAKNCNDEVWRDNLYLIQKTYY